LILFLLIVVLAIVIGVFLIDSLSSGRSDTTSGTQPKSAQALLEKPGGDEPSTPATTTPSPETGQITNESAEDAGAVIDTAVPADDRVSPPKDRAKPPKDKKALQEKPGATDRRQKKQEQEQTDIAAPEKPIVKEKKQPGEAAQPEAAAKVPGKEKEQQKPVTQPETMEKQAETVQKPQPEKVQQPEVTEPAAGQPAAVKEGDTLSSGNVDTNAVPISKQDIKIPRSIRRLMLNEERVFVTYLVDHNGNVEQVKVIRKSKLKRLNAFIVETVKNWKFKPASKNNVKVKVWKNKWFVIKK
jgi:protein TonB